VELMLNFKAHLDASAGCVNLTDDGSCTPSNKTGREQKRKAPRN
jgi:hypothetical protein